MLTNISEAEKDSIKIICHVHEKIQAYQYITSSKRFISNNISRWVKDLRHLIYHGVKKIQIVQYISN